MHNILDKQGHEITRQQQVLGASHEKQQHLSFTTFFYTDFKLKNNMYTYEVYVESIILRLFSPDQSKPAAQ